MELYYEIIGGSRSYGLNIETSDLDICQVSDEWKMEKIGPEEHIIRVPKEEFIRRITQNFNAYYLQWLFPYKFSFCNDLTLYIIENRENIISLQRQRIYNLLLNHANRLENRCELIYSSYPKRMTYAILFFSIICRYADGMSFKEAHKVDGELQRFLLGIRKKEVSIEEAKNYLLSVKIKAESVKWFYDMGNNEEKILSIISDIKSLLNIK